MVRRTLKRDARVILLLLPCSQRFPALIFRLVTRPLINSGYTQEQLLTNVRSMRKRKS